MQSCVGVPLAEFLQAQTPAHVRAQVFGLLDMQEQVEAALAKLARSLESTAAASILADLTQLAAMLRQEVCPGSFFFVCLFFCEARGRLQGVEPCSLPPCCARRCAG